MAKKSFKSGLGSLIQDSRIEFEENGFSQEHSEEDLLRKKIEQLQDELKLWRSGILNHELFLKSLKDSNLTYNPDTNEFTTLE